METKLISHVLVVCFTCVSRIIFCHIGKDLVPTELVEEGSMIVIFHGFQVFLLFFHHWTQPVSVTLTDQSLELRLDIMEK